MPDEKKEQEPIVVFMCGPKVTCPDGSKHDYSKWEEFDNGGTAVCRKCGHRAIDDAYWM